MSAELNAGQRAVLDSRARRIVVSAGAGSGKTRVLAERFVDLVLRQEKSGAAAPMRSVLLITFTDKAAGELTERVRRFFLERGRPDLAREVDGAWISTIHGFCARIVRRHALEMGIDPAFAVLAEPQVGVVRAESFERAAVEQLADPGFARLLEDAGVESLRASTLAAYDTMRSKGAACGDVQATEPGDVPRALRELADALDEVLPDHARLGETATVSANLAAFRELREMLPHLLERAGEACGLDDAAALSRFRGACRGGAEMKELTRSVNEAIDAVAQAVADTRAAEQARLWSLLLRGFEEAYRGAKAALGALDFEDLQLFTLRLWEERPGSAERYSRQFTEVMVDEFQDTNSLQLKVIEPIARGSLCVVGDVQQSIYRFRDADVSLFVDRRCAAAQDPDGEACRLTVNYRSHPDVLKTLNALFAGQDFFGADYLHLEHEIAGTDPGEWPEGAPRVEAIIVDKDACEAGTWREVEARALAKRIREVVDAGGFRPDDVVVLVRASTTMGAYVTALKGVGFDVIAASAGGFFATPEFGDVCALLRVLANPLDAEGVLDLLAGGFGGISDDGLLQLTRARQDRDLWAVLTAGVEGIGLSEHDRDRAVLVRNTLKDLRARQGRMRLADAILYAGATLGREGGVLARAGAWPGIQKAARLAAEFEQTTPADPAAFLRYLDERRTFVRKESVAGTAVEGAGAVRVMTVHAAKGLEFPLVAVADLGHGEVNAASAFVLADPGDGLVAVAKGPAMADQKAPAATAWVDAVDADRRLGLEESKRVFYVACTRAEQVLLLAGSCALSKPPGAACAVDWVRAGAAAGAPGLALTIVAPAAGEEPDVGEAAVDVTVTPDTHDAPKAVLHQPGPIPPPPEISYTALALLEACAYRFFAERMLKVGSLDVRRGDDPRSFGTTLHACLELIARGDELGEDRLAALCRAGALPGAELPRLRAAIVAVTASPAGRLIASGTPEVPFALPVDGGVVRGSMDLLVRRGSEATVLDYKTGATWDAEGGRYAAQAEMYALALLEDGCERADVRFVHVEAGCEEVSFVFTPADRARIRRRVEQAFAKMRVGAFPPLRAFDPAHCADCPVSGGLCPVVHPTGHSATR
jgi:ATP-dependent helicase/nuclease subunit A